MTICCILYILHLILLYVNISCTSFYLFVKCTTAHISFQHDRQWREECGMCSESSRGSYCSSACLNQLVDWSRIWETVGKIFTTNTYGGGSNTRNTKKYMETCQIAPQMCSDLAETYDWTGSSMVTPLCFSSEFVNVERHECRCCGWDWTHFFRPLNCLTAFKT